MRLRDTEYIYRRGRLLESPTRRINAGPFGSVLRECEVVLVERTEVVTGGSYAAYGSGAVSRDRR
jgi:hypothetical protein